MSGARLMRLADFIRANVESILVEWEHYARGIWPTSQTDPVELRDHAADILMAAVRDMDSDQSEQERKDKSLGEGQTSDHSNRLNDASELHGAERLASGFKLKEVIAEYRALRASVVRLWWASGPPPHQEDLDDLTRFHESIDQSLSRAVHSFTDRVDRSRQLFLAILGHDLRNPLNALHMHAQELAQGQCTAGDLPPMAAQISSSAAAMTKLIDDLLTFTSAGLGMSMPLTRQPMDLEALCREAIGEIQAGHRNCRVHLDAEGDLSGQWDGPRLRQVVSNLLGNAIQHGSEACEVKMSAWGEADEVVLAVNNEGPTIPPDMLATLFDPLIRRTLPEAKKRHRPGSIGLGLYIARTIVIAHGGAIEATSTQTDGTTFTVRLPRTPGSHRRG